MTRRPVVPYLAETALCLGESCEGCCNWPCMGPASLAVARCLTELREALQT